ncbi:MAG: ABC transporter ATP-binding protein [Candidatus Bathyarchaeia archaeon]
MSQKAAEKAVGLGKFVAAINKSAAAANGMEVKKRVTAAVLRVEKLRAGYGKKEILRGLSLTVKQGEIVALIGPNGAGKSTLLKVVVGLLPPWEGSVWLNGMEITTLPVHQRVQQGLVYSMQGGEVFPSLTVKENLEMGTLTLPKAERQEAMESVLGLFPLLRENWHRRAGLLSGGQRQALALGMVLLKRPKVLLLDEPSAGLAPKMAKDILSKVQELNKHLGITVLLVEQRVREALQVAHRAIALVDGTFAGETDDPARWLTEGALDAFFFGRAKQPVSSAEQEVKADAT